VLNHHIQKGIIYRLALNSPLRFSELKPAELDNKLFTYHLNIVMKLGLVIKNDEGLYILTSEGKSLGVHVYSEAADIFRRARSVLLLAVRHENSWLMYRRKNEPLKNLIGFMHCEPEAGIDLSKRATLYLKETCSLDASFKIAGSGIVATFIGSETENYINFTVLLTDDVVGNLNSDDPLADYFWVEDKELDYSQLLPSMPDILEALAKSELFFLEKYYEL
jgi:hypothetical protein